MEFPNDDEIQFNHESIHQEGDLQQAQRQSGMVKPRLVEQILSTLGDALCRFGARLKKYSQRKMTSEEASTPTYLIML